jgi:DNA-binding transcriptional regulator YdaS (Cro superfamily)
MNMPQLTTNEIAAIVIAVVALVVIALIVWAYNRRRTAKLRSQFGPEYDRTVAVVGSRSTAENRLAARSERVHKLVIRTLNPTERARYIEEWGRVQAHFVDAPAGAVTEADQLLGDVMVACGYPVGDFEQRAADISVDHPIVTQNYRSAHDIALRRASGQATTEELRRAMIHYRALFDELVDLPLAVNSTRAVDERRMVDERIVRDDISSHRRAS